MRNRKSISRNTKPEYGITRREFHDLLAKASQPVKPPKGVDGVEERDLLWGYAGKGVVTYRGEVIMEDGQLKDTPLAQEWWQRKLGKNIPRPKKKDPPRPVPKMPRFFPLDEGEGGWSDGIRILEDGQ